MPKKKARPLADAAGTFGLDILDPGVLDYATRVGIILNQPRIEKRRTAVVLEAINTALTGGVSKEILDAMSATEEEAEALWNRYKAKRTAWR
jgi:hypothetical protein